jgi:hypothetical protein
MRVKAIIKKMANNDIIAINCLCKTQNEVETDNEFYNGTVKEMPKEYGKLKVLNITSLYVEDEEPYSCLVLSTIDDKAVLPDTWITTENEDEDEDWD